MNGATSLSNWRKRFGIAQVAPQPHNANHYFNKRCWIKAICCRHLTNDLLKNSWKANNNTSINSGGSGAERLERGLSGAVLVIVRAWLHGGGGPRICEAHLPGVPHLHVNRPLFTGPESKPPLPRPLAGFLLGNPKFKSSATLVK